MTSGDVIPVHEIDLAPFLDGTDAGKRATAEAIDRAGRDSGFILLTGHGVAPAVIEAALDAWQEFFERPAEEKTPYLPDPHQDGLVGYTPYGAQALAYTAGGASPPDMLEGYSVCRDDSIGPFYDEHREWFPANVWPSGDRLRAAGSALWDALGALADVVLAAMSLALGQPERWLPDQCERSVISLRSNHYLSRPGFEPAPGQQRLGAHTDYGVMTLLVADPVPGLQVFRSDRWWDVTPPPGGIICNIGDMLSMWTNDRWVSTLHRVVPPTTPAEVPARRRSIARFLDGDPSLLVEPIPSCVSDDEPARYPAVNAGDWLMAKILGGSTGAVVDLPNQGLTGASNR